MGHPTRQADDKTLLRILNQKTARSVVLNWFSELKMVFCKNFHFACSTIHIQYDLMLLSSLLKKLLNHQKSLKTAKKFFWPAFVCQQQPKMVEIHNDNSHRVWQPRAESHQALLSKFYRQVELKKCHSVSNYLSGDLVVR